MLKFEIKKIVTRPVNCLVLLVLAVALVALSALTVTSVQYETEDGRTLYGVGAARRLQEDRKEWTGYLTPDVLKKALAENAAVNASPQAQSEDVNEQNKAFAKKQGFLDLTDLISQAYSPFSEYDYYRVDSVTAEDLDSFYGKRTESLKTWLASGEEDFSPNEQEFLLARFQALDDRQPWYYEYCEGWKALLQDVSTCILVVALITGILVAGVFSEEFQLRADAVYFSSRYGRTKAVRAKMGAGFLVTTLVYWGSVLVYSLAVLALLGWDGAGCPLQFMEWRTTYNLTLFQTWILMLAGGYVGTLFSVTVAMVISAKTHSTVAAAVTPFVILCALPFLSRILPLPWICSFFPDQLMQIAVIIHDVSVCELGGKVMGIAEVILPLYLAVSLVLWPVLYRMYQRSAVK